MAKKLVIPANPLIYRTALQYAAVFYEAGRSSGLTSQYKTPEDFAKRYMERFIPMVIKNFMAMLKPNSGRSDHEKATIYEALMDPVNDPRLMKAKVNTDLNLTLFEDQRKFNKLKVLSPIQSKKTVLHKDR